MEYKTIVINGKKHKAVSVDGKGFKIIKNKPLFKIPRFINTKKVITFAKKTCSTIYSFFVNKQDKKWDINFKMWRTDFDIINKVKISKYEIADFTNNEYRIKSQYKIRIID